MQKISFIIPSQPAMWREQMTARHKEYGKQQRTEQFTKEILRKIILVAALNRERNYLLVIYKHTCRMLSEM